MWCMSRRFLPIACVLAVALLAGCASTKQGLEAVIPQPGGLVANLRSPTSAVTGSVRVYNFRDGVQVQLSINNMIPGSYRIAFHENGNCRSPNLFSAGAPWAPATWTKAPGDLLPGFFANPEGNNNGYVAFVQGVSTDGPLSIRGRSAVIHWGTSVDQAFPGQPNNRMACGVLESAEPIF
jgi:Cu/Zn superoxide dismutase